MTATTRLQPGSGRPRICRQPNQARKGKASASRQKPAATGPTSARRTIHGPAASARLAAISAGKAKRPARARVGEEGWCIKGPRPLRLRPPPRQGREGPDGRPRLDRGRRLYRAAAGPRRRLGQRGPGQQRRFGPGGDRRLAGAGQAASHPGQDQRGPARARDRHARRLLQHLDGERPAGGRTDRDDRDRPEDGGGGAGQFRPLGHGGPDRSQGRCRARRAAAARRPVRPRLHRRRQGQQCPLRGMGDEAWPRRAP